MHDERTHPLLQQVPLTVSPFVNLPTAITLPYTYKPMPSALPPSALGITAPLDTPTSSSSSTAAADRPPDAGPPNKPKYVVSPSGHAAHPDEILASCRALRAHVAQLQARAEQELAALEERIRARELAEKRRVAPGWLDSDARLLEPDRVGGGGQWGEQAQARRSEAQAGGCWQGEVGGGGGAGVGFGDGAVDGGEGAGYYGSASGGAQLLWQGQGQLEGSGPSFGNGYGLGPGGASEMAVPDQGQELDRAFGSFHLGKS